MRKLLLGLSAAADFWMNDAGAMEDKAIETEREKTALGWRFVNKEVDASIIKCISKDNRFLMINRWELGNCSGMEKHWYLHVDYSGTEKKFERARKEADLTQEMRDVLCTLPASIKDFYNLKILNVCSFKDNDNYVASRGTMYRGKICLRALPDSIGNLTKLRILDLSSNDLRELPDSIGNLKNLEELYLSKNYEFSKLPDSIGNLESLKILELEGTNLDTLPESIGNLTNLENLSFSKATNSEGPHSPGCCRAEERIYKIGQYSPEWYHKVINQSLRHWSCPTLNFDSKTSSLPLLDLSEKNLKQIPFGVYMLKGIQYKEESYGFRNVYNVPTLYATPALKELDVSNNQITKIPRLLEKLWSLEKLYMHNNPNLNYLPDFLWEMRNLKELKIDGKLARYLPKDAQVSLDDRNLEDVALDLALTSKNNKKMSDEKLSRRTGPYTVRLNKQIW